MHFLTDEGWWSPRGNAAGGCTSAKGSPTQNAPHLQMKGILLQASMLNDLPCA